MQKITSVEAKKMMDNAKNDLYIVDVREAEEQDEGYIADAILIPLDTVKSTVEQIIKNKNAEILVYCRSGKRSKLAAEILDELGYTNVYDFGGIIEWPFDLVI